VKRAVYLDDKTAVLMVDLTAAQWVVSRAGLMGVVMVDLKAVSMVPSMAE
jgi:hypothetical protein